MIHFIPAIHISGGRIQPRSKVVMVVSSSATGPRKLATIPIPEWIWARLVRRWRS